MSCEIADAPVKTKPDTTAKIVAKATALMNDINTSPPKYSANNGAAVLPALLSAIMFSAPTRCRAPKPKKIVNEKKIAVIQVVQEIEERAVFASLTVKKRIRMCGK